MLNNFVEIPIDLIHRNRKNPRRTFNSEKLQELANDLAKSGLINPITVRRILGTSPCEYEIIAGERRWRAAQMNKWQSIESMVIDVDDEESAYESLSHSQIWNFQ